MSPLRVFRFLQMLPSLSAFTRGRQKRDLISARIPSEASVLRIFVALLQEDTLPLQRRKPDRNSSNHVKADALRAFCLPQHFLFHLWNLRHARFPTVLPDMPMPYSTTVVSLNSIRWVGSDCRGVLSICHSSHVGPSGK